MSDRPQGRFRGLFGILVTPFREDLSVDEDSLRREVDFCVDAGAHGLVTPVISSEFHTLSDDERRRVVEVVVEHTAGRVPVVAGVSAVSTPVSIVFARHAVDTGADAVIATPPITQKLGADEVFSFYRALASAVSVPVVIQNAMPPLGTPMAPALVARIAREIGGTWYVKQETVPSTHDISEVVRLGGDHIAGVFGGSASRFLIEELRRGAIGLMSGCHLIDVQRLLYDRFVEGNESRARETFARLLPIQNIWSHVGIRVAKEVLRRRGVIASSVSREAGPELDVYEMVEIDWALDLLVPDMLLARPRSDELRSRSREMNPTSEGTA